MPADQSRAGTHFGYLLAATFDSLVGHQGVTLKLHRLANRWPQLQQALAMLQWGMGSAVSTPEPEPSPPPRPTKLSPVIDEPPPSHWVELEHKVTYPDDDGQTEPAANVPYRITFANGHQEDGSLDANGRARHAGIVPGQCGVEYECGINDQIAELQNGIQKVLDEVIAKERKEAQQRRDTIKQENIATQGVIYTGAALEGAKDATVGLVKFVGEAIWGAGKMIASIPAKLNPLTMPRRFKESVAELKEAYHELREFADEDLEVYWTLASDDKTWSMLTTFAKDYTSAQHATEWAESGGSAVPTVILALVTGGAGAAAGAGGSAASGASRLTQLGGRVGPKLKKLVELLKRRRAKQAGNGPDNTTIKTRKPVVAAKYSRSMAQRRKALLRDADDPNSGLSPEARDYIKKHDGKKVPKDYEVDHDPPLYSADTIEGKKALDVTDNMKTIPKPRHRAMHKVCGIHYHTYGPANKPKGKK